jgi:hypothetical protein
VFFLDTLWPRFYQRSVKVHDRCKWLTYVRLLAPSIAAQTFGCFVLLDVGPYRLVGGGTRSGFYVAAKSTRGCDSPLLTLTRPNPPVKQLYSPLRTETDFLHVRIGV